MSEPIHIVLICDRNFVIPTAVCIESVISSKAADTKLEFHIVAENILDNQSKFLIRFNQYENVHLEIIPVGESSLAQYHHDTARTFRAATMAALYKFSIPDLFPELDKILYMDGDTITKKDLTELWKNDISGCFAGVVVDSGVLYSQSRTVKRFPQYFNSGVLLLNLQQMRDENCTERLIECKKSENESTLVDQNVLNTIFEDRVRFLPLTYNFLFTNLTRAAERYTEKTLVEGIRKQYDVSYSSIGEIMENAVVVHFSSRDKPWKKMDNLWHDEWFAIYQSLIDRGFFPEPFRSGTTDTEKRISFVLTVFGEGLSVVEWLRNSANFLPADSEVIVVVDGAVDCSVHLLQDACEGIPNVQIIYQSHHGKLAAQKFGVECAAGKYVCFPDPGKSFTGLFSVPDFDSSADVILLLPEKVSDVEEGESMVEFKNQNEFIRFMKKEHPLLLDPSSCLFPRDFLSERPFLFVDRKHPEDLLIHVKTFLSARTMAVVYCDKSQNDEIETPEIGVEQQSRKFDVLFRTMICFSREALLGAYIEDKLRLIREIVNHVHKSASDIWNIMNTAESQIPVFRDTENSVLSRSLFPLLESRKASPELIMKTESVDIDKRLEMVYQSTSYRVGNAIVTPVKKIVDFVKGILKKS